MFKKLCPNEIHSGINNMSYIDKEYVYWRRRITLSVILGYSFFYCVRQNFTLASASKSFPFDAESLGWGFSLFCIIYGAGKFISGIFCDRFNVRHLMSIGLLGASLTSVLAGCVESAMFMAILYAANACFQSFGAPSAVRTMTQWFGPKDLGTRYGIVNSSHQIGSIIVFIGGAWLIDNYGWRQVFIIPGVLCSIASIWLFYSLRSSPQSVGLPSIEAHEGLEKLEPAAVFSGLTDEKESWWSIFRTHILLNVRLWMICFAKFFVYFIRMGYFFWGPKIIAETQGITLLKTGVKTASYELAGILGGILAGWYTDKHMPTKRGIYGVFIMISLAITLLLYVLFLKSNIVFSPYFNAFDTMFWCAVGFCVFSSQALGGLIGSEFGSRKAAATAFGLTGLSAYLGGGFVGIGVPKIAKYFGWESIYLVFIAASLLSALFFGLSLISNKKTKSLKI